MGKRLKDEKLLEFANKISDQLGDILKSFLNSSEGVIIFSIIILEGLSQLGIHSLEYLKISLLGLLGAKAAGELIPF